MHLQGTMDILWFHHPSLPPATYADRCLTLLYLSFHPYRKALALVPYFMHLARLKWHESGEGDECVLANPNRCKVKIGLMHEGSARAGINIIGGTFR